ncbi:hypothetical protein D5086_014187 [Populus alba]|uniref:Uncharacterized protein n=1 Tax=Populus alba TaxID=43335 RepID=A0ACC4BY12_POPAL
MVTMEMLERGGFTYKQMGLVEIDLKASYWSSDPGLGDDYIIKPSQSPLMAPKMPINRMVSLNCESGGLPRSGFWDIHCALASSP